MGIIISNRCRNRTAFSGLFLLLCNTFSLFAQPGKDGVRQVSTAGTIVNEYTTLTSDITAGTVTIAVNSSTLNAGSAFSGPLSPGDLIMIIQLQGAVVGATDDTAYGSVTSYGNCGRYELCQVAAVPGPSSITLSCGTSYSYSSAGRTQVIRVPRYRRLTINSGGSLTAPGWNGSIGGVLVVESDSSVVINSGGAMDVNGKGFRGGVLTENLSAYGVLNYRWSTGDFGAEKGEGIAGFQADYDTLFGRYCKGAPANGGGGANGHNCGGGGGANAGDPSLWTGKGIPDITTGFYASAWNLELPGFSGSTSSGGGKGGYSFSSSNQDALTIPPGSTLWGGDYRRDNGGRGGRPLDYSSGRLFLGGGGGAGDQNDNRGGSGANGGGMVFITTRGTVSGAGIITANGNNGFNSVGSTNANDAAGGGGAGGTVIIDADGSISGISVNANGGRGGNQNVGLFQNDAYGPGGGGGGGYIGITNGSITRSAVGGANGVTSSSGLLEFPPNGATKGGNGTSNATYATYSFTALGDTVCSGGTATLSAVLNGVLPSGTVLGWYTQPYSGNPVATGLNFTTPNLSSTTTYYLGACPGFYRIPVQVTVDAVNSSITIPSPLPCAGSSGIFSGNGFSSVSTIIDWSWNFNDGTPLQSGQSVSHGFLSAGTYLVVLTATNAFGCQAVAPLSVTVPSGPAISFSTADTLGCAPFTAAFSGSSTIAGSYLWDFGDGSTSSVLNPFHTYSQPGTYTVSFTVLGGQCLSVFQQSNYITVGSLPRASFSTSVGSSCAGRVISFSDASTGNGSPISGYSWDFGDGSVAATASPQHTYALPGTYTVQLSVDANGCSDDTTVTLSVLAAPLSAFQVNNVCLGSPVVCTNQTTGGFLSYFWDFGDGSSGSSLFSPDHLYSDTGTYSITLTAVNGNCQDDTSISVTVYPVPDATVIGSPVSGCYPLTVNFSHPVNVGTTYSWIFGDGTIFSGSFPVHTYTAPGTFSAQLIASRNGCSDTGVVNIVASSPLSAGFTASNACFGDTVHFLNSTPGSGWTAQWDFGDGTTLSGVSSPGHNYTSAGVFAVTLNITDASGCQGVFSDTVTVLPSPLVSFSASVTSGCDTLTAVFTNSSTGAVSYLWSFGDGSTSSLLNPTHQYLLPGVYDVSLTAIGNNGCSTDFYMPDLITLYESPTPVFSATSTTLCDADCIGFNNQTLGNPIQWQWSFVGGTPSTSALPSPGSICYYQPGDYSVTLTVTNAHCTSSFTYTDYVHVSDCSVAPIAGFICNDSTFCVNGCTTFMSTALNATSWYWSFPGGSPSSSSQQNPSSICYPAAGDYPVTLVVGNPAGTDTLVATSVVHIANVPPVPSFTQVGDTLFAPQGYSYQWYINGTPIPGANSYRYLAIQSGNYSVSVTNASGCRALSQTQHVSLVGLVELLDGSGWEIYPNPFTDQVNLRYMGIRRAVIGFELRDAVGRSLLVRTIIADQSGFVESMSLASLSPGAYYISLTTNSGCIIRKVVKL